MGNYLNLLQASENISNQQNTTANGSITDWLMVIITFVYVIATIFICIANIQCRFRFLSNERFVFKLDK